MSIRRAARAAALILVAIAAVWAVVVLATGGFVWRSGSLRITARDSTRPSIAALLAAAMAWALSSRDERRRTVAAAVAWARGERGPLRLLRDRPDRLAPMAASVAAVAIVLLGLLKGSFVAGGADAYGYVSQADLWARGQLVVQQPFAREMTWPGAANTLSPLGYRPLDASAPGADLVPVYSPGLPIVMAVFKLLAGSTAVFWVVPLLGGLAVWATYALGRDLAGRVAGGSAAVLLAASPSFLFEVTSPTSDVPATAWWVSTLALVQSNGRWGALAAGVAASLAILTRPNLVVLAVLPGLFLLWCAWQERSSSARDRVLLFAAGSIPGALAVAVINWHLYGSPLASGYPGFNEVFGWGNLWANFERYPRWLLETQTPIVFLAVAAPFLLRRPVTLNTTVRFPRPTAVMWCAFIAAVLCSYLFYLPFDDWVFLRFLLPAYPPLLVLAVATLIALSSPLERIAPRAPRLFVAVVVASVGWYTLNYALDRGVLILWQAEQRYVAAGQYIAARLPERAALLSMQHSGSARYYSGRLTVRYDFLPPTDLDAVIEEMRRLGYFPYLLLDDWEEPVFRERFKGQSALAPLDWWPVAMIQGNHVRIYDPADRRVGQPDRPRTPDVVP